VMFFVFGLMVGLPASAGAQKIACRAPQAVCSARASVFVISSFDPLASAVRIGPDILVTNRHITVDQDAVTVTLKNGTRIPGRVIATGYKGDLVLIKVRNLPAGPIMTLAKISENQKLYTVGADIFRRKIRVYPPGKILLKPSTTAPFARLYHTALSRPGNSGGALVDDKGRLVGIVTAGGEGRYEAFPTSAIEKLKSLSGDQYIRKFQQIGVALRACIDLQDAVPQRSRMSKEMAQKLSDTCRLSNNRQLMDNAAVMLGQSRYLKLSQHLLEKALLRDPQAINTRLSLITALTFSRRYKQALPHIRQLLAVIPQDASLQRYAIQAGKFGEDMALANQGLALVKKYNPAQAEAAARFLAAPLRKHEKPKAD